MVYLVVAICTTLSGCSMYESPLPDGVTIEQCRANAPAILAQIKMPADLLLAAWSCETDEPV